MKRERRMKQQQQRKNQQNLAEYPTTVTAAGFSNKIFEPNTKTKSLGRRAFRGCIVNMLYGYYVDAMNVASRLRVRVCVCACVYCLYAFFSFFKKTFKIIHFHAFIEYSLGMLILCFDQPYFAFFG